MSFHCFPSDLSLRLQAIKRVAGRNIKLSESEQKLREELQKAQEKNTELEKSLDARSKEVTHPRSQLFPFDNKKVDSKQLEFFTSLSRETWDCVWNFLGVQFCKDILSAKSAATED